MAETDRAPGRLGRGERRGAEQRYEESYGEPALAERVDHASELRARV